MQLVREEYESHLGEPEGPARYPMARVACYGPNDSSTTRLVVWIFLTENVEPVHKEWVGDDVLMHRQVWDEQQRFLDQHRVETVTISLGIATTRASGGAGIEVGANGPSAKIPG